MSVSIHVVVYQSDAEIKTRLTNHEKLVEIFIDTAQSSDISLRLAPERALELQRLLSNTLTELKGTVL